MLELVVAGYGIAYALGLVLGGRLGDAFGRRRLFLAGTAGFAVTSLACGLAPTAGTLVAARVAQGAAAGVAALGSLYLSLAAGSPTRMRDAFLVVLAVQGAFAAVVALLSRRLPSPTH